MRIMSSATMALVALLMAYFLMWLWRYSPEAEDEVFVWLDKRGLAGIRRFSPIREMTSLEELAALDVDSLSQSLPEAVQSSASLPALREAVLQLDLQLWLKKEGMEELFPQLMQAEYTSRDSLMVLNPSSLEKLASRLRPVEMGHKFLETLRHKITPTSPTDMSRSRLSFGLWLYIFTLLLVTGALAAVVRICSAIISVLARHPHPTAQATPSGTSSGRGLVVCRLEWNHDDKAEVGVASVATLHLSCKNSTPYKLQASDMLKVTIKHTPTNNVIPHVVEPAPPTNHSKLRLSFTTRLAGAYSVEVIINGRSVADTPTTRTYLPGPVDPSKTTFIDQTQWLVLTAGTYHSMRVAPRDVFGNTAIIEQDLLTVNIRKGGTEGVLVNPECVVERINSSQFELLLKVDTAGHYIGSVLYENQQIGPPQFTIISLSARDAAVVDRNLQRQSLNVYYEASMTTGSGGGQKKVYCYLYPKQLQVKEFYLKIIPYRLYTCKVCPSTNIRLHSESGVFTLDDGYQSPVTLCSRHREIIAATFYKYLLRNIGGSEQFKDKRQFFYSELRKHHSKQSRSEQRLTIDRFNLLQSTMQATKGFSLADWCKSFDVAFRGEEALDWGGVSRELFQMLSTQCFNCSNGMFRRFKDDPQALVHPNHNHPASITPRHYEFAGRVVGKCLYESAHGNVLLVSARFTRSFLAQIIRLRINYKYFESDDPDLYRTKIQYIRDNDVSDLELLFADEEFSDNGTAQVVPLVEHGEEISVTETNKNQYLNLLAQHRLAKQCKTEMEHFLTGLNELVPDNLLGIFDENELELLMCGTETVSYEDLKKHTVVAVSHSPTFHSVVSWFWLVVSNFTPEEMARLLQFVTGSSQLPPGGFKELNPKFQITPAPTHGRLPSAHTCFNQLCLPEYDSCEQFQPSLMMALNEGVEGFGIL